MSLLAILAALALEQWRAFEWRASVERAYSAYVRGIELRLNGGTLGQGILATVLAVARRRSRSAGESRSKPAFPAT